MKRIDHTIELGSDGDMYFFGVVDKTGERWAEVYSPSFPDGLRQALHYVDPVFAGAIFPAYYKLARPAAVAPFKRGGSDA